MRTPAAPHQLSDEALYGPPRARQLQSLARAWVTVAFGAGRSLAASVVSRRSRETMLRLAGQLGYEHVHGPAPALPRVGVESLAGSGLPVVVREPVARDGNVTLLELLVLNRFVAARRPRRMFEIGSFDFRTTINLAANAPDGATVFTLDLPPSSAASALRVDEHDRKYIGRGLATARPIVREFGDRIVALHGDSATYDFSPYRGTIDLVFVDGAHSYEYVARDSESALAMAVPGALIVWHDYGAWPGVTQALNELFARDARFARLRHVADTTLAVLDLGPEA